MLKDAFIDPTEKYRYFLSRIRNQEWNNFVNFIMLNPSTADANIDDPTIKSCIRIAKILWYDWLYVTNLFAYRSTNPKRLYNENEINIIWPKNDEFIKEYAEKCNTSILARGEHWRLKSRYIEVLNLIKTQKKYCLWKNKSWQPKHPLYVKSTTKPILF